MAPVLSVSPTSLAFTGVLGGANPASQSVSISNTGAGTLNWAVSDDATWLTLNPTSGTNAGTVTASVSTAALAAGTYGATITVTGNAANAPRTVAVTLTVTSQPAIGVSPTSLAFSGPQGGSNPASQTLAISNTGGGTLNWTSADDAAWLTLSPLSGTNAGNVTVSVNTAGLAAGSYSATITITGNASNSPHTVPVTLTVIASSGQVQGRVSTVGGAPLASAQVLINELQRGATTNATGDYVFTGVPPGTYGMTASLSGYLAQSVSNVVVTAGQTATVNFSLTALPPPPAAPSALVASAVSNRQINLSWMDLSSNETGFRVESCTGATCTTFAVIATLGANVQSYQHTNLNPGTTYRYRVQAYNLGGSSAYSQIAAATTPASTPVLSAGSYTVWTIDDPGCSLYGPTRLGTSFRVVFSFTDADGDVPLSSSAVGGSWVFSPSGVSGNVSVTYRYTPSVTGSGSSGTVTTYQCYVFGSDAYVDVTMTMTDATGRTGTLAPIRIGKPAGAN